MNNYKLEKIINLKLNSNSFKDIIPNGLQVEGCNNIKKIFTGVTICQELIDFAIIHKAEAIIVHHGFFWNNESKIIEKIKKKRLKSLLKHNINLYSWHLPLDAHDILGNNAQIAKELDISVLGKISDFVFFGKFNTEITVYNLLDKITCKFERRPLCFSLNKNSKIKTISWCSGKGQKFISDAVKLKLDAFLTGEVSEETMHYAYENKINFFSAGHYSTEKYGIKALGKWISKKFNLEVQFVDIYNPV